MTDTFTRYEKGLTRLSVYIDARSGGAFFSGKAEVAGDVVGRDQVKDTAPSASSTLADAGFGRVLRRDITKMRDVYVKPTPYARAERIVGKKHVLVLWGQVHGGKWTTALHVTTQA